MISVQEVNEQRIILEILEKLPPVKSVEKRITKLDVSNLQDWENILDSKCRWKLNYQISIVNSVKNPKWIHAFINKKGLDHLAKIIMDRNIEKENYKTFTLLMNFFCEVLKFFKPMNIGLPFKEQFLLEMFKIPKFFA